MCDDGGVCVRVCVHIAVYSYLSLVSRFMFVKSGHALSKGFWRLDLLIESNPILEETHLTYKKELLPPYPLDIPYKASFHCSDATYCVERHPITDKCDPKQPFVTISGLQVNVVEVLVSILYASNIL